MPRTKRPRSPPTPGECAICGKVKANVFHHRQAGGPVCYTCYRRELQPRLPCKLCGQLAPSVLKLDGRRGICGRCYRDRVHLQRCGLCQRSGPVWTRSANGTPVCVRCYSRGHVEECALCGRVRRIHQRLDDGRAVCPPCARRKILPAWRCARCARESRQAPCHDATGRPLCIGCYLRDGKRREICTLCGRLEAPVRRTGKRREPVCQRCAPRLARREPCTLCGQPDKVVLRRADGSAVCPGCYQNKAKPHEPCTDCGRPRPVHKRLPNGDALCNTCVKWRRGSRSGHRRVTRGE